MQKHINSGKEHKAINQKKADYLKRVEEDQKGNPLLKPDVDINLPLSDTDKENMKYQDTLGNPIKGYKWCNGKIIKESIKCRKKKINIDGSYYHRLKDIGINVNTNIPKIKKMIKEGKLIKAN
mgnify:FL=1